MQRRGFSFVELILVITVLGLLGVAVFPKFIGVTNAAQEISRDAVSSAVRAGIALYKANAVVDGGATAAYPEDLDSVSPGDICNSAHPCFVDVLFSGIDDSEWRKESAKTYTYVSTGTSYEYDSINGHFNRISKGEQ